MCLLIEILLIKWKREVPRGACSVEYREKRLGLMPPATVVLGDWSLAGNSHCLGYGHYSRDHECVEFCSEARRSEFKTHSVMSWQMLLCTISCKAGLE